jgi:Excalibur calcium-binding domain
MNSMKAVRRLTTLSLFGVLYLTTAALIVVSPAAAGALALYSNCTNVHRAYPHGIGRANARDHTSGTPVTTFKRSDRFYRLAMSYNSGLDRDKDGIACEQA